jgi:hypothetical protein
MKIYNDMKKICFQEESEVSLTALAVAHKDGLAASKQRREVAKQKSKGYDEEVEEAMTIDDIGDLIRYAAIMILVHAADL